MSIDNLAPIFANHAGEALTQGSAQDSMVDQDQSQIDTFELSAPDWDVPYDQQLMQEFEHLAKHYPETLISDLSRFETDLKNGVFGPKCEGKMQTMIEDFKKGHLPTATLTIEEPKPVQQPVAPKPEIDNPFEIKPSPFHTV